MSHWIKTTLVSCALTVVAATTLPASADTFLKITGVAGESVVKGHEGSINALSWTWAVVANQSSRGEGPGRAVGRPQFTELAVTKSVDSASPALLDAAAKGTHLKDLSLTVMVGRESSAAFVTIKLTDVLVSAVQINAPASASDSPTESVSFNFGAVEFAVTPRDAKGGKGKPATFKYDSKTGK